MYKVYIIIFLDCYMLVLESLAMCGMSTVFHQFCLENYTLLHKKVRHLKSKM